MNIDELTVGELKQIAKLASGMCGAPQSADAPFTAGEKYFVRTVTHHFTGRLVAVYPSELVFESVAWIADSGRFADALKSGTLAEVEPYPDVPVIIGRGSLIDASPWAHDLPSEQK